jgi:inner membrane transporter RhtA
METPSYNSTVMINPKTDSSSRTSTTASLALLLAAMASFQAGASIAKTLFPLVGPIGAVALRVALGAIVLCVTMRPWRARIHPSAWRPLLVYGISMGLMNMFFYMALNRLPQGIAVAIEFVGPLSVAVLSSRRSTDFVWVFIAGVSLVMLLPITHIGSNTDLYGILLALAAGACWALYIVSGQRLGTTHGIQATAIGSVIAACIVAPIGVATCGSTLLTKTVLIQGLFVAVLSTVIPYTLEMVVLARLPMRTFGILMSLEPALGALTGFVWLGERLTLGQWVAIVLVIVASAGATLSAPEALAPKGAATQ